MDSPHFYSAVLKKSFCFLDRRAPSGGLILHKLTNYIEILIQQQLLLTKIHFGNCDKIIKKLCQKSSLKNSRIMNFG